jgi:acetolactate synthase regulatory subunit
MNKTSTAFPLPPYSSATARSNVETHTLSVLVDSEPGVLARVVGMFSGRGYNSENLTVVEVAHETHLLRITVVTSGTREIIKQIRHQLEQLVPVHSVKGSDSDRARAPDDQGARQGRKPGRGDAARRRLPRQAIVAAGSPRITPAVEANVRALRPVL